MMDLGNLAERLVDLSYDYDPYEFHDNYTDKEEALCEVLKSLETGDVDTFVLFCCLIADDIVAIFTSKLIFSLSLPQTQISIYSSLLDNR